MLLLDTHVFLWFITGDRRVQPRIRVLIENADQVYLSVASIWEVTIKYDIGKISLPKLRIHG